MLIIPENSSEQQQQSIDYDQLRPEGFFQTARPVNEEPKNGEEEDESEQ